MQRLWSRAAPAQSSCRCMSCLSTGASGITSRAASAASKKRLRIGNSVTALYTSIFAAAALADAQAKDQRRLEWKEKIAAVKEEVNELVDEEQRIVAAIMARRNKKKLLFGGIGQIRQYSTDRPSMTERSQRPPLDRIERMHEYSHHSTLTHKPFNDGLEDLLDELDVDRSAENADTTDQELATKELDVELEDENLDSRESEYEVELEGADTIPDWLATDVVRMKCLRKLAMKQLAIRFLLRPIMAHSYMGLRMRYDFDYTMPRMNVKELLGELNAIRIRMREIKTEPDAYIEDLAADMRNINMEAMLDQREKRKELDELVRQDTEAYMDGEMSLPELLLHLANNIMRASDPDRPYALRQMLMVFGKTRQNDLGDLVLKTVLPNRFPLNSTTILTIMHFYRKSKNLKGFDMFLEMIRGDLYPVDMGNLGFYKRERVNGVVISVPPVHATNAVTWSTLILCCLRFDQLHRANAYLSTARKYGYMDDFATLNGYLKFFALRKDWGGGLQTIQRSLAFLASSTAHPEGRVQRIIARMVHLCDECNRGKFAEVIIAAAMNSGFLPRLAFRQADITFSADPEHKRWYAALQKAPREARGKALNERIYKFVNEMRQCIDALSLTPENRATKWAKLTDMYSREVLSSVHGSIPEEYKTSGQELQHESSEKLLRVIELVNENARLAQEDLKATSQQEINSLKDEVAQLKQMVFELASQSPARKPRAVPTSAPNDLGELKEKLATPRSVLEEPPQRTTVQYYQTVGNAS